MRISTHIYISSALAMVMLGGCASLKLPEINVKDKNGDRVKDKNGDRFFTAKPSGRVMIDYTNASGDNSNLEIDNVELRRTYLGVGGKIGKELSYALSGSLGDDGEVGLVNAYIDWKPKNSDLKVRVGQFKTPMSLDESTSSKYTATLERSAFTDAIDIDRRLGVGVFHTGKKHTLSAGVFGGNIESQPFASSMVVAGRATYAPINKKDQTLHIGASARYRTNNDAKDNIRYRQRPFTHVADRIISTGRIAESDTFTGVEAAIIRKNLWAAGEYSITSANCPSCDSNPKFDGYYAEAGVVLGGRRTYKDGSFGRPKVDNPVGKGGYGAVALVARYDGLDLNDRDTQGGDLNTAIVGVDWWPTDHVRVGVNYFNADASLGTSGSGLGDEFNVIRRADIPDEKVNGFVVRVQYDF